MVVPPVRSPGKRLESTPEKENSLAGSWNLDLGRFQRKCAEISASLSQPSLGDRVRAETARSGDAPLPSTSTVLQGEAWSPSPNERGGLCSERSPLQDCTVQVQVQSPPAVPCTQFRSPGSPLAAKAAVQLVQSPSLHPMHPVPTRWCLPEFEDLRRKMQHSQDLTALCKVRTIEAISLRGISALQRSNAQQAEMQAALSQADPAVLGCPVLHRKEVPVEALQRGESFKEEAQEARRSKDRHHHKWCALDQEPGPQAAKDLRASPSCVFPSSGFGCGGGKRCSAQRRQRRWRSAQHAAPSARRWRKPLPVPEQRTDNKTGLDGLRRSYTSCC